MTRNQNPFTDRQLRLLVAIRAKIQEITDPNPDIIRHDRYEFYTSQTKRYGRIVKIRFPPRSTAIKAELAESAGLYTEARREKLAQIRKEKGIKTARNTDAMLFEEEWNAIAFKLKKAMYTTGLINFMFAAGNSPLAEPCRLMQQIVMTEYPNITDKRNPINTEDCAPATKAGRSYTDELMEVE
jgi:hypothetical protein